MAPRNGNDATPRRRVRARGVLLALPLAALSSCFTTTAWRSGSYAILGRQAVAIDDSGPVPLFWRTNDVVVPLDHEIEIADLIARCRATSGSFLACEIGRDDALPAAHVHLQLRASSPGVATPDLGEVRASARTTRLRSAPPTDALAIVADESIRTSPAIDGWGLRAAATPFAVALDAVTMPFQLLAAAAMSLAD